MASVMAGRVLALSITASRQGLMLGRVTASAEDFALGATFGATGGGGTGGRTEAKAAELGEEVDAAGVGPASMLARCLP